MRDDLGGDTVQKIGMEFEQVEFSQTKARDQVNKVDQVETQNRNQEGANSQKDNKAIETLQDLEKDNQ